MAMVIRYTKLRLLYFIISAILIIASIFCIFRFGLKTGIDFTGGSILEVEYKGARTSNQEIRDSLKDIDLGDFTIQPTEERGVILKMKDIPEDVHQQVLLKLGDIEEKSFETIGPSIGAELKGKTMFAMLLALISLLIYIAIAFIKVQKPMKSWQYSIASITALLHDIIIPLGVFSYLGMEITIPVITALLTVLGYSINNVVVVFDRIRENLFRGGGTFEEIVDKSLNQTLSRQINTSLTVLFCLFSIYFFGGETLKSFSLALMLGILTGMYSAFFIAGPLLVSWQKMRK